MTTRRRKKHRPEEIVVGGSRSWLRTSLSISRCSSTSRREAGLPFPESSGGRRAPHEVWRLRAKAMHGSRSSANRSGIQWQAPHGRGAAGEADAAVGEGNATVCISPNRLAASRRRMACGVVSSVSTMAAGGPESAGEEADKTSTWLECKWMPSATGRGPE